MARTGAERQAAYRARQSEASDQRRISTWINSEAALALEVLADRYGVTNSMINKDSGPLRVSRKRRVLPSNDLLEVPFPLDSLPANALPRNAKVAKSVAPQLSPENDPVREPARGEQYSMEL
jgi:hypothetical protein